MLQGQAVVTGDMCVSACSWFRMALRHGLVELTCPLLCNWHGLLGAALTLIICRALPCLLVEVTHMHGTLSRMSVSLYYKSSALLVQRHAFWLSLYVCLFMLFWSAGSRLHPESDGSAAHPSMGSAGPESVVHPLRGSPPASDVCRWVCSVQTAASPACLLYKRGCLWHSIARSMSLTIRL